MKMKIWIEEAMKEMVEEVEKNEPMPKHWKRSAAVLLVVGRLFSDGTFGVGKKRHCFR